MVITHIQVFFPLTTQFLHRSEGTNNFVIRVIGSTPSVYSKVVVYLFLSFIYLCRGIRWVFLCRNVMVDLGHHVGVGIMA